MESLNKFFQDFVSASAGKLVADGRLTSRIDHKGLKGSFREYTLANFFRDFLPITYGVGRGSIQDAAGGQSPESDLVIWQKDLLPPALFSQEEGVYPLEACRYWFEVKSVLSATEIAESLVKARKVLSLIPLQNYDRPWLPMPMPILFAYASDQDGDELARICKIDSTFYNRPVFCAFCIIGKGYWTYAAHMPDGPAGKNWMHFFPDENNYEIVALLAGILNSLAGRARPSFGYYILDPEGHGKAENV